MSKGDENSGDGSGRSWATLILNYNNQYRNGDASMSYSGSHDSDDLLHCTVCDSVYSAIGDPYHKNYTTEIYPEYFFSKWLPKVDCPLCDPDNWDYGQKRMNKKNGNV